MKLMRISCVLVFSGCMASGLLFGGDLTVVGETTTSTLTISSLNCKSKTNNGALSTNDHGQVYCSDDDGGGTLDEAYDRGGAGAGGTITADSGAVLIEGVDGLELDTGSLLQIPGDPVLVGSVDIPGLPEHVVVSGRYAYVLGGSLDVVDVSDPEAPIVVGSFSLVDYHVGAANPTSLYVSGRYAYVTDSLFSELTIIDVSDPANPSLVSSQAVSGAPQSVYVSGRYAYVIHGTSDNLYVVDISNPLRIRLRGSLSLGGWPRSVFVSGRFAYVVDSDTDDLKVIDVSDPSAPSLSGSVGVGAVPRSVYVSGRYAYVVDSSSGDLRVIDVSDASAPAVVATEVIGGAPISVFVSGRYAYVPGNNAHDLKVIDVIDPTTPVTMGSLAFDVHPIMSAFVSGRYAYVVEFVSGVEGVSSKLHVIDVSGAEFTGLTAHSLEAGNLQVRNDVIAQGQLQVKGGVNVGAGGIFSDGNVGVAGNVGVSGTIAIAEDVVPTSTPTNVVQLYADGTSGSSELKVRDEAGNVTLLSPHNFSLTGQPSEPMAWSFYSENDRGRINVDMLRTIRLVEILSGQKLVYTESKDGSNPVTAVNPVEDSKVDVSMQRDTLIPLIKTVNDLKSENERLRAENDVIEQRLLTLEKLLKDRKM